MSPRKLTSTAMMFVATASMAFATGCGSDDEGPGTESTQPGGGELDPEFGLPYCSEDPSERTERCVDNFGAQICPKDSGWAGDGLALCAPEERSDKNGLMLHYGPQDYDDPEQIDLFRLEPGGEEENCTFVVSGNTEEFLTDGYNGRMREGSHHLIVTTRDAAGFVPTDIPGPCSQGDAVGSRWLVGSQDPQIDVSTNGRAADERQAEPGDPDYHLGQLISAETAIRIDMHYTNPTDHEVLREGWVYFHETTEDQVDNLVDMITWFQGTIDVQPGETKTTARARCVAPTDRYVGLMTAHFHELGTRMSMYHETAEGETNLLYETYDWADPGNLYYFDGVDNPTPNEATNTFGGHSGYAFIKAGEAVSFECEYTNFRDVPATLGDTAIDEMCNVFGMYYPSDGDVWNCMCMGPTCFGDLGGINVGSLLGSGIGGPTGG